MVAFKDPLTVDVTVHRNDSLSNRQFIEPTVYRTDSLSNNSLSKRDKLTSKKYAKTVNLQCAGKNVFVKYQA